MVAMKGLLPYVSPLLMGSFRLLPSGFILVAVAAAQGRPPPASLAAWAWVGAFALVDGAAFQVSVGGNFSGSLFVLVGVSAAQVGAPLAACA